MAGFRATSGGVTARFATPEAIVLRDLVTQIAELVGGEGADGPPAARGDDGSRPAGDVPGADELAEMVGMSNGVQPAGPPDDPILARLLPDGYTDDDEAASDFRRFTEPGLRSAKLAAARTVLATVPPRGGRVRLSTEQAEAWLRALNDVRLALGVRLGVTDDSDGLSEDLDESDPRFAYIQVYQWLSYIQESLILAL
jgi:Domain of unknown function (DUF2017)